MGFRDVTFCYEHDEVHFNNLAVGLKFFVKDIREAIVSRKIRHEMVQVSEDQYLFLFVTELGNIVVFDLETSEHLCFIPEKAALDMLQKIRLRYINGKVFIRRGLSENLLKVPQISWREFHRYNELGLKLYPGERITKAHILKGHRIFQESYAKKHGFEPESLENLRMLYICICGKSHVY